MSPDQFVDELYKLCPARSVQVAQRVENVPHFVLINIHNRLKIFSFVHNNWHWKWSVGSDILKRSAAAALVHVRESCFTLMVKTKLENGSIELVIPNWFENIF